MDPNSETDWVEPSDSDIEAAAESVIAGNAPATLSPDCLAYFFVESPDTLKDEKLRFLFNYWRQHTDPETGHQSRAEFDMLTLKPAVGNIMILDVLRDGFDARFRLYGTGVSAHAGRDWTGATVSEMNRTTRTNLARMYRGIYRAAYRRRQAIYSFHRSPAWLSAKSWSRLVLPMTYEDDTCTQFIVGNIPVETFYLSGEQETLQQERLGKRS